MPIASYTAMLPLNFPHGLIGYEHLRSFQLLALEELQPLLQLRSDQVDLGFLLAPAAWVEWGYHPVINLENHTVLGLTSEHDAIVLVLLSVPEKGPTMANLRAPIVANLLTGVAVQAVRDDQRYNEPFELLLPKTLDRHPCLQRGEAASLNAGCDSAMA